mgnify:FL=1
MVGTGKDRLQINRYELYSIDETPEGLRSVQSVLRSRYSADMASTKHIPIDQLTVGMFIAGLDQPWYRTPFLLHKWLVSNPDDIVQLKRHGIHPHHSQV